MGSQIVLTTSQQFPFRLALKKLRDELNNPASFEYMVTRGLTVINLIAEHLQRSDHPNVFDDVIYHGWSIAERRGCFFGRFSKPKEDRVSDVRKRYELLRTALNTPSVFSALARIGPCVLTVWNPEDASTKDDISIMIHNWVGRVTMPNCDYELTSEDEVRFTS